MFVRITHEREISRLARFETSKAAWRLYLGGLSCTMLINQHFLFVVIFHLTKVRQYREFQKMYFKLVKRQTSFSFPEIPFLGYKKLSFLQTILHCVSLKYPE